jgi:hypothetical protein
MEDSPIRGASCKKMAMIQTSSQHHIIRTVLIVLAFRLLSALPLVAQIQPSSYVQQELDILGQFFPSLKGVPVLTWNERARGDQYPEYLCVRDVPFGTVFLFRNRPSSPDNPHPGPETVLQSNFRFNVKNGSLEYLHMRGEFLDRLDRFRGEVNAHPEWTDAQIVAAFKAAGGRFGPNDRAQFLRALPLKILVPFTERLDVVKAGFRLRFPPVEDLSLKLPAEADLWWRVVAKPHRTDKQHERVYTMLLEPFDGRPMEFLFLERERRRR